MRRSSPRDNNQLRQQFTRLLEPEASFGMELCKLGLMDALWNSDVERRLWSLRYRQQGRLRLIAEMAYGNLHGEFILFYPDEKPWIKGAYWNNQLVKGSMKVFMPDGTHLAPAQPPDNLIPFPAERRKE